MYSSNTREKNKKEDAMGSKKPWIELTKRIWESGKSKGVICASGIANNQDKLEKKDWLYRENYCQLKGKRGWGKEGGSAIRKFKKL